MAFFLPFATVSCNGESVAFTGAQLASYSVPDSSSPGDSYQGSLADDVEGDAAGVALVALVAALWGLAAAGVGRGKPGVAAAVGLGAMLVLLAQGALTWATVDYHVGFWLVLALYLGLTFSHARAALRRRRRRRATETRRTPAPRLRLPRRRRLRTENRLRSDRSLRSV